MSLLYLMLFIASDRSWLVLLESHGYMLRRDSPGILPKAWLLKFAPEGFRKLGAKPFIVSGPAFSPEENAKNRAPVIRLIKLRDKPRSGGV